MAALSVLRNRNNQKLREGFEDFLARCSEKSENKNEIDKIFVMESLEKLDVKMDPREREKLPQLRQDSWKHPLSQEGKSLPGKTGVLQQE